MFVCLALLSTLHALLHDAGANRLSTPRIRTLPSPTSIRPVTEEPGWLSWIASVDGVALGWRLRETVYSGKSLDATVVLSCYIFSLPGVWNIACHLPTLRTSFHSPPLPTSFHLLPYHHPTSITHQLSYSQYHQSIIFLLLACLHQLPNGFQLASIHDSRSTSLAQYTADDHFKV